MKQASHGEDEGLTTPRDEAWRPRDERPTSAGGLLSPPGPPPEYVEARRPDGHFAPTSSSSSAPAGVAMKRSSHGKDEGLTTPRDETWRPRDERPTSAGGLLLPPGPPPEYVEARRPNGHFVPTSLSSPAPAGVAMKRASHGNDEGLTTPRDRERVKGVIL